MHSERPPNYVVMIDEPPTQPAINQPTQPLHIQGLFKNPPQRPSTDELKQSLEQQQLEAARLIDEIHQQISNLPDVSMRNHFQKVFDDDLKKIIDLQQAVWKKTKRETALCCCGCCGVTCLITAVSVGFMWVASLFVPAASTTTYIETGAKFSALVSGVGLVALAAYIYLKELKQLLVIYQLTKNKTDLHEKIEKLSSRLTTELLTGNVEYQTPEPNTPPTPEFKTIPL